MTAIAVYLGIGTGLATYWYFESPPVDRPPLNLAIRAALLWPVVVAKGLL